MPSRSKTPHQPIFCDTRAHHYFFATVSKYDGGTARKTFVLKVPHGKRNLSAADTLERLCKGEEATNAISNYTGLSLHGFTADLVEVTNGIGFINNRLIRHDTPTLAVSLDDL